MSVKMSLVRKDGTNVPDLMIERDSGNPVRILMGVKDGRKNWLALGVLCSSALGYENKERILLKIGPDLTGAKARRASSYTAEEALQAIKARLAGEFDNLLLMKLGPLLPDAAADVSRILRKTGI